MNNMLVLISLFVAVQCLNIVNSKDIVCEALKESFANASAKFTLCAIEQSRPITLCEKCPDSYKDVLVSFQNMSKRVENNTSCLDMYINQDRLQIIKILYDNSVDLWTRAKCYECYDEDNDGETGTLSNKTVQFQKYYQELLMCINKTEELNLCSYCMKYYVKLDNYYKSISNVNEKIGVCMDLVDIMNTTWVFWSSNCCRYRRHHEYIFIGSSVGVLLLTIIFYAVTLFYKEKRAPTIIQQSRFFGSMNIFQD